MGVIMLHFLNLLVLFILFLQHIRVFDLRGLATILSQQSGGLNLFILVVIVSQSLTRHWLVVNKIN